jgi:SPP1 gp7 family putative phage head morphogenesis protein
VAQNPLNVDPTRTMPIQKRYMAEMVRRINRIRKALRALIVVEDAFGLKQDLPTFRINKRWSFDTSESKEKSFRGWLTEQVDGELLETDGEGKPWQSEFVKSSYKQGAVRAYSDTHGYEALGVEGFGSTRAAFMDEMFDSSVTTEQLRRLYTRNFDALDGVSKQMGTNLSRILADGLAHGLSPVEIAKRIDESITKISRPRALMIARTEIVYAHAEGQLDSFERMGVEELNVFVEWDTAGDRKVCPKCKALSGVVLTIKQARGILPRHPNCRCAWVPAFKEMKEPGQKWGPKAIQKAFERSYMLDKPRRSKGMARRLSPWAGAGKTIKAKRR